MKRIAVVLTALVLIIITGCSEAVNQADGHKPYDNKPDITSEKHYTEDDAIALFRVNNDADDYIITDSVLVDDNTIPRLKAVISFYDKKDNNDCNLAFITDSTAQIVCFAANEEDGVKDFEIADSEGLSYTENGAVATSIRKIKTNEVFDYTIIYSFDESTTTTNFKVISNKRPT